MEPELEALVESDNAAGLAARLDRGVDVNASDSTGESLLSLAAASGSVRVVELLLERGAAPNLFAIWPAPLVRAVEAGHLLIVELLIAAGADVGSEPWCEDADLPLVAAMQFARWRIAERLLASGAIEAADERWLGEILEAGLEARGRGRTAVLSGSLRRILERFGQRPLPIDDHLLDRAAKLLRRSADHRALGEELASRVDAFKAAEERISLLFSAEVPDVETIWALVRGAPVASRARLAAAAFCRAGLREEWSLATRFLDFGMDLDYRDANGRTPVMYVAWEGEIELLERLVGEGANLRAVDSDSQNSVIDWSRKGISTETVDYLEGCLRESADRQALDAGADRRLQRLAGAERQREADHLAVEAASEGRWERAVVLLGAGAEIDGRGRRGRTLLMYAVWQGDRERACWLVSQGADPEASDDRGEPVSMYARGADPRDEMFVFWRDELRRIAT